MVLWDDHDLEIVGAYRIGECRKIIKEQGEAGLYTHTLFDFKQPLKDCLPEAIELGRSFVQPRYWGKRSLDYLWFGIGAYLRQHPDIKYLFGPVSLSQAYPAMSKDVIVAFYKQQFGAKQTMAVARLPYIAMSAHAHSVQSEFTEDYKKSVVKLKKKLKQLGVKVPTLYKQYTEVCEQGGCQFLAFNLDPDFNYCIDSLILVELDKIKEKKKRRYIGEEEGAEFDIKNSGLIN